MEFGSPIHKYVRPNRETPMCIHEPLRHPKECARCARESGRNETNPIDDAVKHILKTGQMLDEAHDLSPATTPIPTNTISGEGRFNVALDVINALLNAICEIHGSGHFDCEVCSLIADATAFRFNNR